MMLMSQLSPPSPAKLPPPSLRPANQPRRNPSSSSSSPFIKGNNNNVKPLENRLIQNLNAGDLHSAISALDLMTKQGIHPDLITYSLLLKSCIRSRKFHLGKLVHSHLTQSGITLDSVLHNSLITLYSKSGDSVKANSVFENMGSKRDLVSWSAMISCYANNGMESEAILTFLNMIENGFEPNEYCFTAVLRACSKRGYASIGRTFLGFLMKCGYLDSELCVGCSIIDMFVKGSGDLESACKVFDKMPEKNLVTWTLMITRCSQLGYPQDSIDLFLDMIELEKPDKFTLTAIFSACAELKALSLGQQLHSWAIRSGMASDVCVGCSLVDMYVKCVNNGSMEDSRKVFDRMSDHDVMSWTALITGYVQSGGYDKQAIQLFSDMLVGSIQPNQFTFPSVLKACGNLSDSRLGEQVYSHAVKRGLSSDNCVGNSLISMYARSDRLEDARKTFESLFEKNLVSYNTIVDAYSKNLDSSEAFELFNEIGDREIGGVNAFTFASLLSGASSIGSIGKGEQIHAQVLKSGFESNRRVCNALIFMYSKCGNIESAFQVFDKMKDRNVISWTSMITGFAKHGNATRALQMFNDMVNVGVKPNEITFISVLTACSHVGLVSVGKNHFESMLSEHGIVPRTEHYACMVDLLTRSGSLTEALEFINSMPFEPDVLIWRIFLSACRVHNDKELGEHAARMILERDPRDPAAYVLLSNLYASTGEWDDVAEIRRDMKRRNLTKEAGCSWIEVESRVHKFHVGDTLHPRAREIYVELDRLGSEIKRLGYVPDTEFVLYEIEEEEKERFLFQHSEKIAVAFGLISTVGSKPIRVFKNLRVCGDCHTAIKYISKASGREIVLRDSNRFHHMKDGKCSCNDYW